MSRPERVGSLLRQIENGTVVAFNEHMDLLSENSRLESEDAKLRELIGDLYAEYKYIHARQGHSYVYLNHEKRMREIEDRMRKLGIEVV